MPRLFSRVLAFLTLVTGATTSNTFAAIGPAIDWSEEQAAGQLFQRIQYVATKHAGNPLLTSTKDWGDDTTNPSRVSNNTFEHSPALTLSV